MDVIVRINNYVNGITWGALGLTLVLGTGFICSVITGFFQVSHFRHWWISTFAIMYKNEGRRINDDGALSQLRTFCMVCCATIGTGNIAGVSTAICMGGPGAVFWMWIAAFLGMMVKYSETVLGYYYRRRNSEGAWSGGPMYYLQDGLGSIKHCKHIGRILGILFCVFAIFASFGIGNMSQINKITINVENTFLSNVNMGKFLGFSKVNWLIGIGLMIAAAVIILGGFRRLAAAAEVLIPSTVVAYMIGCGILLLIHFRSIPAAFVAIFRFALGPVAIKGGAVGTVIKMATNTIKNGCKRGVFSNEAGMGSSVMVHCNSCAREPVRQGMWGIAEVCLDTMMLCTLTALVILTSGFVDLRAGTVERSVKADTFVTEIFGAAFGKPGEWFVVVVITLFAFTTVLGWSFHGAKVTEYLFGVVCAKIYRLIFIVIIVFGALMESNLAWDISDTFNGLMMMPNIIGVIVLLPIIIKLTRNYVDRRIRGKDIRPMLSFDTNIQKEAERAIRKGAS